MDAALTKGASWGEVVLRLLVAIVIGGLIGFDRQRSDKPAGLRTHMLVALGSASFTLLGFEVGAHLSPRTGEGFDPTRVLQGVIGGIGFLGAGAIIQNRGHVSGITTAASVWVAGALGAAAGVGAYVLAGVTTVLAFVILSFLVRLETKIWGPQAQQGNRPPPDSASGDAEEQHSHAAHSVTGAGSDVPKVGE
jgi:putative Mg2+ transporter-C (MgtC) family protein